jgi:hypothetical protein
MFACTRAQLYSAIIPQSAAVYRAAVLKLNSALKDPTERDEARALIAYFDKTNSVLLKYDAGRNETGGILDVL